MQNKYEKDKNVERKKNRDENRDSPVVGRCREREKNARMMRRAVHLTLKKVPIYPPPTLASSHTPHSDKPDTTPQHLHLQ